MLASRLRGDQVRRAHVDAEQRQVDVVEPIALGSGTRELFRVDRPLLEENLLWPLARGTRRGNRLFDLLSSRVAQLDDRVCEEAAGVPAAPRRDQTWGSASPLCAWRRSLGGRCSGSVTGSGDRTKVLRQLPHGGTTSPGAVGQVVLAGVDGIVDGLHYPLRIAEPIVHLRLGDRSAHPLRPDDHQGGCLRDTDPLSDPRVASDVVRPGHEDRDAAIAAAIAGEGPYRVAYEAGRRFPCRTTRSTTVSPRFQAVTTGLGSPRPGTSASGLTVPVVGGGAVEDELVDPGAGIGGVEVAGAGAAGEAVDAESEDPFPFMLVMKNTAARRARPPRMAT